jgi:hypothetical protein
MSLSHLIAFDFRYISGLPELRKLCFVAWQLPQAGGGRRRLARMAGFYPMLGLILDLLIG